MFLQQMPYITQKLLIKHENLKGKKWECNVFHSKHFPHAIQGCMHVLGVTHLFQNTSTFPQGHMHVMGAMHHIPLQDNMHVSTYFLTHF